MPITTRKSPFTLPRTEGWGRRKRFLREQIGAHAIPRGPLRQRCPPDMYLARGGGDSRT